MPTPAPVPVPNVTVNANGLLELPYNQQFAEGQLSAVSQANDQLVGLNAEANNQALSYQNTLRQTQGEYGTAQRTTKNANAGAGTLLSSKYGTGVVNNASAYANKVGEIENQNAAFQQDNNLRRTAIQTSLNNQLAQLSQQYTDKLSEEAGTLGYGQSKTPTNNEAYTQAAKAAHIRAKQLNDARAYYKTLKERADRSGKPADRRAARAALDRAKAIKSLYETARQKAKDYRG